MSKVMERMEKLKSFKDRGDNLKARIAGYQADAENLDKELSDWMQSELGLSGQTHISEILIKTLESSFEPQAVN